MMSLTKLLSTVSRWFYRGDPFLDRFLEQTNTFILDHRGQASQSLIVDVVAHANRKGRPCIYIGSFEKRTAVAQLASTLSNHLTAKLNNEIFKGQMRSQRPITHLCDLLNAKVENRSAMSGYVDGFLDKLVGNGTVFLDTSDAPGLDVDHVIAAVAGIGCELAKRDALYRRGKIVRPLLIVDHPEAYTGAFIGTFYARARAFGLNLFFATDRYATRTPCSDTAKGEKMRIIWGNAQNILIYDLCEGEREFVVNKWESPYSLEYSCCYAATELKHADYIKSRSAA